MSPKQPTPDKFRKNADANIRKTIVQQTLDDMALTNQRFPSVYALSKVLAPLVTKREAERYGEGKKPPVRPKSLTRSDLRYFELLRAYVIKHPPGKLIKTLEREAKQNEYSPLLAVKDMELSRLKKENECLRAYIEKQPDPKPHLDSSKSAPDEAAQIRHQLDLALTTIHRMLKHADYAFTVGQNSTGEWEIQDADSLAHEKTVVDSATASPYIAYLQLNNALQEETDVEES